MSEVFILAILYLYSVTSYLNYAQLGIKKAFAKFDTDGNGLLDLAELTMVIKVFLNGISDEDIARLIQVCRH